MFKKFFAEFIGTAVLVLFACGVAAVSGCSSGDINTAYIMTALAFGGVIVAMAYSIGNISGCHINPAVSIAVWLNKGISSLELIGYLVSQFLGGIAGAAVLSAIIGSESGLGCNHLYDGNTATSLLVEIILTFVFVLAVLGATSKKENGSAAGLVIGGSLTLVHFFGIYFTGTSVNPARSLGPAIFVGGDSLKNVWVFIAAPIVGGVLSALVWKLLNYKKADK